MAKGLQTYSLIAVKHPTTGQRVLMAEKDFDPKEHELFDGEAAPKKAEKSDGEDGKKDLTDFSKMGTDQMKAFAAEYAIDMGAAKSKAEMRKVLEDWKEKNKA